jgi:hypothetical protein
VGQGLRIHEVLDHTQRGTTVGRNPLDEWSARRRDLYVTTQTLTTDKHPCNRCDSNPQFQQASGLRPRGHWNRQYHYNARKNKIAYPLFCRSHVNRRKARRQPDLSTNCPLFCSKILFLFFFTISVNEEKSVQMRRIMTSSLLFYVNWIRWQVLQFTL